MGITLRCLTGTRWADGQRTWKLLKSAATMSTEGPEFPSRSATVWRKRVFLTDVAQFAAWLLGNTSVQDTVL
jgi:hypothetical protein